MTAKEKLLQKVEQDRSQRGASAKDVLQRKVEQDRAARAQEKEMPAPQSGMASIKYNGALLKNANKAPVGATDAFTRAEEGKRLKAERDKAEQELYTSGGQLEYENRLRAADAEWQNWWNANPDLHTEIGEKLTVGENLDYFAGRALKGLGSAAQGTIGFADKLIGDDLAILGSLVDATTEGRTQLEKPIQKWADNALKADILGAKKFGQGVEGSIAGAKPSAARDFIGGISESAGAMLPAIATGGAASAAGLGAGTTQALNYLVFGSGAAGNAAKEAINNGASADEAVQYGLYSGMLEVLSESMFAGITGMNPSGALDDILKRLKDNGTIKFLTDTIGEGVEEGIVTFLTPYIARATYDPQAASATWKEMMQAISSGAAMSLLMNSAAAITSGSPEALISSTKDMTEQQVLQDKYGRVEEETVADVFRNGSVTPVQKPAAPAQEEVKEPTAKERLLAAVEADKVKAESAKAKEAEEEIPRMELKGIEDETEPDTQPADVQSAPTAKPAPTGTATEKQRMQARAIGDMVEAGAAAKTSPAALGIENGGDIESITVLEEPLTKMFDFSEASEIAEKAGYEPVYFSGMLQNSNGGTSRWGIAGNKLYIQADSANYTAADIAKEAVERSITNEAISNRGQDERYVGLSAGGQVERVSQQGGGQTRRAAARANKAASYAAERASDYISTGSTEQTLKIIPAADYDGELKAIDKTLRKMGAKKVYFTVGSIGIVNPATGESANVSGVYDSDSGVMMVRADSDIYTAQQLAMHEAFHYIADADPTVREDAYNQLLVEMSEGEIEELAARYQVAYGNIYGNNVDAYVDEILADAYAGINRENLGADRYRSAVNSAVMAAARPETKQRQTNGPNERYTYGGANANNANLAALRQAQEMEKQGVDAETIFQTTGWYIGADGKWRFEIDDSQMKYSRRGDLGFRERNKGYDRYRQLVQKAEDFMLGFSTEQLTEDEMQELTELRDVWSNTFRTDGKVSPDALPMTKLADYISHEELFQNYPQLRNTSLVFGELQDYARGQYDSEKNIITLREDLRHAPEDTIIHEIQHAIQRAENFATGSTPEYFSQNKDAAIKPAYRAELEAAQAEVERWEQRFAYEWGENSVNLTLASQYAELNERQYEEMGENPDTLRDLETIEAIAEEGGWSDLLTGYAEAKAELSLKRASALRNRFDNYTAYRNTAGEIEARDAARRRTMTAEQRRATMPDVGNEDTVFAENAGYYAISRNEQDSIKEQLREHQDMLNAMEVVSKVNTREYAGLDTRRAREKLVSEMKKTGYKVDRQGFGEIQFEENEINNSLNYKEKDPLAEDARRTGFLALQSVLKRGIEIDGHDMHKGRNYDTVTIAAPVEINGKRGNMAVVVKRTKGNRYKVHRILTPEGNNFALPEMANAEVNTVGAFINNSQLLRGSAPTISSASTTNVAESGQDVKQRFSIEEDSNGRELTKGQKEFFANSKATDWQGRLLTLYHQTENEFTVFDTRRSGAGSRDEKTPFGIFLKSSDTDIGLRGKKQMELYANIENPLVAQNREDLTYQLRRLSPEYDDLILEHEALDNEYHQKFEDAKTDLRNFMTEWRKNNPDASRRALYDVPKFDRLYNAEDSIIKEWTEKADALSAQAKEVLTQALRDAGYDGVFLYNDAGSWGRSTDAYIALDSEQVKNVNNVNPTNNPDIRYSADNTLLLSVARKFIREYSSTVDALDVSRELEALRAHIQKNGIDEHAQSQARSIARNIIENASEENADEYKSLRDRIKSTGITLDKAYEHDLMGYENLNEFRKKNFGKIKIVKEGLPVDVFYSELATDYPGLFNELQYNTPADQLTHIADVISELRPDSYNPYSDDIAGATEFATQEILAGFKKEDINRQRERVLAEREEARQRPVEPAEPAATADEVVERKIAEAKAEAAEKNAPELLAAKLSNSRGEFTGSAALEKLGIKIVNSIGKYSNVKQLLGNARAGRSIARERKKAEIRLKVTAKEKNFARGIANGIYTESDIPEGWDKRTVMEMSEWYMAERNFGESYIDLLKQAITVDVDAATAQMFEGADESKVPPAIVLNHRTAQRNMLNIFGDKGKEINKWLFDPVNQNEAERLRFINRQFDQVRTFADQTGKQRALNKAEREMVQRVIEGRVVEDALAKLENRKDIEDAAYNLRNGKDIGDIGLEFGLTLEEQEIVESLVKWQDVQNQLEAMDKVIIYNAVDKYSALFDSYYEAINDFLAAHGYQPIGFIKGYVPHLQPEENQTALQNVFQKLGLNTDVSSLPTSIAGLTGDYKPNKKWNPYFLHRNSTVTQFDIVEAFESYVSNMADVLYHADDIMRIRSAVKYFRRTYSPEEIRNSIEWAENLRTMPKDEKIAFLYDEGIITSGAGLSHADAKDMLNKYIEEQYSKIENTSKFNNLVTYLENYANILAGKQSIADRGSEYSLGRKILNAGNRLTRIFSRANVAGNLSSALNQSAQLPTILTENGLRNTSAAFKDILTGNLRKAGWAEDSDFLTGKRGVSFIVNTPGEMVIDALFKPLEIVDSLMSTMAVRGAYLDGIKRGMSHEAAMQYADKKAAAIMGDRTKGAKPLAFEAKNPISSMVHLFQVEVLNSWDHIVSDLPQDFRTIAAVQGKRKAAQAVAGVISKMLVYSFVLNRLAEKLYGGTPALFDIFGLTANFIASGQELSTNAYLEALIDKVMLELFGIELFGSDEDESMQLSDGEFEWEAAAEDLGYNISNEIPFLNNLSALLGLGDKTLPLPDLITPLEGVYEGIKNKSVTEALDSALQLVGEIAPAGRQVVKTYTGAKMIAQGGKMKGFGEKARLQYPVRRTAGNITQALLFGASGLQENQDFYASGSTALTTKETTLWKTLVANGADEEDAYDAIYSTKGEDVKTYEKLQMMAAPLEWSNGLKYDAMAGVTSDSFGYKLNVLESNDIDASEYADVTAKMYDIAAGRIAKLPEDDRPETVTISQEDAEKALKAANLSKQEKAIIWQMTNAGWSDKSNPFSNSIGKRVKAEYKEIKEQAEEEKRKEEEEDEIPRMQLQGLN